VSDYARAVELGFKKPRFLKVFLKKPKKDNLGFLGFLKFNYFIFYLFKLMY